MVREVTSATSIEQLARNPAGMEEIKNDKLKLDLLHGKSCWRSGSFTSSGDRPFWRSASAFMKFRHSCWRRYAFSPPESVLYAWLRLKGTPAPSRREWVSASVLGALIFLLDYGCLFWAEQRVPSGVTAVVLATIPVFIALLEIIFLRTQKLTVRLGLALAIGIVGVAVLMNRSFSWARLPSIAPGALALLVASATLVDCDDPHSPRSASSVEGDERGRPDGHRRSDALRAGRGVARVCRDFMCKRYPETPGSL